MKKRCQVVMLPTNEKAAIVQESYLHNKRLVLGRTLNIGDKGFHLYILSNDEIKEGDWYYIFGNRPQLCQKKEENRLFSNFDNKINGAELSWYSEFREKPIKHRHCFKIIATTDTSLTTISRETIESQDLAEELYQLPRPSNEFIKKYCKKGGIDFIMVKYQSELISGEAELVIAKDNTISCYTIKSSWNREELNKIIHNYTAFLLSYYIAHKVPPTNKLIDNWTKHI